MYRRNFMMSIFDKNTFLTKSVLLSWAAGLSLGVLADRFYGEAYHACFLLTPHQIPGFFGTLCVNTLPLLICAYAFSDYPVMLLGVCLCRGILTGSCISAAAALYGTEVFRIGGMLLFNLLLFGPVLLWYCLRRCANRCSRLDVFICLVLGIFIARLDQGLIAPMLCEIMIF